MTRLLNLGPCLFIALSVCLAVAACSSGSKSETEEPGSSKLAKLAPCTDLASVPGDATSCLLDLGAGTDSYWVDSDGVDPGTAGCHDEYADGSCSELKRGRAFGELCLDDDRLVESNPGAGECHAHGGDAGKPDVVSCSAWCKTQNASSGKCEGNVEAEGASGACVSARCVCS